MQYVASLTAFWRSLPPRARVAVGAAAVVLVAVCVFAGVVARAPRGPLFATPLHPEQLAEVEERLAAWNVAFAPTADNVSIETARRGDVLLRLSLAGVPHAHVETTDEALATVGALTPQAVIDAQTRAGLAGDIEAALRGVDGVDDARVIVAPAKPAEFADETARAATASVRLRTRAGTRLGRAAVAGIKAFVAAAVPGLQPGSVTILDDSGSVASDAGPGGDAADVQNSLQAALDAAYGDGATIVRVRAEYSDDRVTLHDLRRNASSPQPIEESARDESYDDGGKHYRRNERTDDRGSQTKDVVTETPPGSLRRLSTAVFVDRARVSDTAAIRELAAATVGYDPRRGDTLAVAAISFHRALAPRRDVWWLLYGAIVPLLPALAGALAIVLAARYALPQLIALVRPAIERLSVANASRAVAGLEPSRVRSVLANEPPHAAAAVISALPTATAAAVLDLYPQHEREAILRRMQRPQTPLLHEAEEILRAHA